VLGDAGVLTTETCDGIVDDRFCRISGSCYTNGQLTPPVSG